MTTDKLRYYLDLAQQSIDEQGIYETLLLTPEMVRLLRQLIETYDEANIEQ